MAEKSTAIAPRERQALARREPFWADPLGMLERFADEMERIFDEFGLRRGWFGPRRGRRWFAPRRTAAEMWVPDIEVYEQNGELVIRADLPGMKKDEITVETTERDITISGERRQEEEIVRGGLYRSERSYGSFCRTIPLPEGARTDQAKATFRDGVLEIRMPAPAESRARRIEIKDASEARK